MAHIILVSMCGLALRSITCQSLAAEDVTSRIFRLAEGDSVFCMKEASATQTIALVDDDRNILTSVSIALESEGYRVETYTDGASALDGLMARPALRSSISRCRAWTVWSFWRLSAPEISDLPRHLPHVQGRRDRRAFRPQNGRG